MTAPQETDVVHQEVRIAARPETIFPFFTDPEKMKRWQGIDITLDPKPGGIYRVNMNGNEGPIYLPSLECHLQQTAHWRKRWNRKTLSR